MATESTTDFTLDTAAALAAAEDEGAIEGKSPWYLAWRRLRRNYVALAFLLLFFVIVAACLCAPPVVSIIGGMLLVFATGLVARLCGERPRPN